MNLQQTHWFKLLLFDLHPAFRGFVDLLLKKMTKNVTF